MMVEKWRDFCFVSYVCLFFFFQAEDGIRDLTVTGVQTCALPILATEHMWPESLRVPVGFPPVRPSTTHSKGWRRTQTSLTCGCWIKTVSAPTAARSEEHTSELQSQSNLVCRLLLEKKTM